MDPRVGRAVSLGREGPGVLDAGARGQHAGCPLTSRSVSFTLITVAGIISPAVTPGNLSTLDVR